MTLLSKLTLSVLTSTAMIASSASAQLVLEGGRPFTTTLRGAEECNNDTPPECGPTASPAVGDQDGTGLAKVTLNPGQRRVCWEFSVNNIAQPTRAHIHNAPAGRNGPIVVDFFNVTGTAPPPLTGCVEDERATIIDIIKNPQNYYFNVHNADWPGGAVRGQLSKKPD